LCEEYFASWLVIDSNRHRSWIVSNWTELLYHSNVVMKHNDGYNDDVEKAKTNMVTIDCLELIKWMM
jgi:phosphoribosyl-ATP pyrophosphohydrolase